MRRNIKISRKGFLVEGTLFFANGSFKTAWEFYIIKKE